MPFGRNPKVRYVREESRVVKVTVVMRTYDRQMVEIVGSLSSLCAAAQGREGWLKLSVVVLNTGQER